ncbi:MAG: membrane-bound lytic murein transglycosylase MltF [Gammaproteobacteria bacterium]|nr:membrane-bound lytic murein transglycosylase MltF [Gammaproteobacteria bacterium]
MAAIIVLIILNAKRDSLDKILQRGELVVITRNGPTTYYEGLDGKTGLEYDLAEQFAEYLGVDLRIIVSENLSDMIPMLNGDQADFIAAGLAVTEARKALVRFTPAYQEITQQLIYYRKGKKRPRAIDDIIGGKLEVVASSSFDERLRELHNEHPELSWKTSDGSDVEKLLQQIVSGKIDYTIVDSNEFELHRRFYPGLNVAFDISEPQQLAWAFRTDQTDNTLYQRAADFFAEIRENGTLTALLERHYGYAREFKPVETTLFLAHAQERLPPYQYMFIDAAEKNGFDWRLLAAVSYQESHWVTNAVSPTGVRGIMMITEKTAGQLGVLNRLDARESISAGARYLKRLHGRIPDDIEEPDRTWMTLAAYNVGFGHLEDARKITESQGGDPDKWQDVRKYLPLLSEKKWHRKTKHGYARGWEPVVYVRNIRSYYDILVWMDERENQQNSQSPRPDPKTIAPQTL